MRKCLFLQAPLPWQAGGDHRHKPRRPERSNRHGDILRPRPGTIRVGVGWRRRNRKAEAQAREPQPAHESKEREEDDEDEDGNQLGRHWQVHDIDRFSQTYFACVRWQM